MGPLSRRDYSKSSDRILKKFLKILAVFEIQLCITQFTPLMNKIQFGEYFLLLFSAGISSMLGSPPALTMLLPVGMMKCMITSQT